MSDDAVEVHKEEVVSDAEEFINDYNRYAQVDVAVTSHRLFVVRPTAKSRQVVTVNFGSNHLVGFIATAYARYTHAERLSFYKDINGHPLFNSVAGRIFKTYVLIWLRHASTELSLRCFPATNSSPQLDISPCGDNLTFLAKDTELKNVDEFEHGKCFVPVNPPFSNLDAVLITDKSIITLQMAVASSRDAKDAGIYGKLPDTVRNRRQRCHVFITDTEKEADSLRQQTNLTGISADIHVYSASFDVEQMDPIVTEERVTTLNNDIVSRP